MSGINPANRRNILFVTTDLRRGGAETIILLAARRWPRSQGRCVIACMRGGGGLLAEAQKAGIAVHQNLIRHKLDVRVIRRLRDVIEAESIGAVIAVGSGGDRMFWSVLAARKWSIPVFVWSHTFPVPGRIEFERLNRLLYHRVAAFIALGEQHRQALATVEGVPAERIHVVRNGIEVDAYDRADRRAEARAALGLADDAETVAVGLLANLRGVKRPDIFIEAARRVHALRKNTRFFLIGDGPCRARVEEHAAEVDAAGAYVHLLGERADVPLLLQGLDIVCLSSRQECFSLAMLEAMAAGRAFIAPRTGSLDEALKDGRTGLFLPELSPDALAAAIQRLVDNPVERLHIGEAARALVHTEFRCESMVESLAALVASFAP